MPEQNITLPKGIPHYSDNFQHVFKNVWHKSWKNNFSYEGVGKHNQLKKKNRLCGAGIIRQRLKSYCEYVQLYEQNDLHSDWKEGHSQQNNWININGPTENFIVEDDSVEYEKFTGWN